MTSKLHFPNQDTIRNYLENEHPLTKTASGLKEKKVFEAVAKIFADQYRNQEEIKLGLAMMLNDVKYKIPQTDIINNIQKLLLALHDCAKGRKF